MKAIQVKYHGPTNYRGSRYTATDLDGNKVTVSYDYGLNHNERPDKAALALCHKMNWTGTLVRGELGKVTVYCFLQDWTKVEIPPAI